MKAVRSGSIRSGVGIVMAVGPYEYHSPALHRTRFTTTTTDLIHRAKTAANGQEAGILVAALGLHSPNRNRPGRRMPMAPLAEEKMKAASIDRDNTGDRQLQEISAADLVRALNAEGLGAHALSFLPEKKKFELYTEPENVGSIRVADLLRVLRNEKKKVELEQFVDLGRSRFGPQPDPWLYRGSAAAMAGGAAGYPNPDDDRRYPWWIEIRKLFLDDRFERVFGARQYEELVSQLARDVAARLPASAGR